MFPKNTLYAAALWCDLVCIFLAKIQSFYRGCFNHQRHHGQANSASDGRRPTHCKWRPLRTEAVGHNSRFLFETVKKQCPFHLVCFNARMISYLVTDLVTDLMSNFGIPSTLNHTINCVTKLWFMVWFDVEAILKSDTKFVCKSYVIFDISI